MAIGLQKLLGGEDELLVEVFYPSDKLSPMVLAIAAKKGAQSVVDSNPGGVSGF